MLRRLPVISGSVVDGDTRAAIVGASVTATPELSAITNAAGEFSIEIDGDWPKALRARAPGRAEAIVDLPEEPQAMQLRPVMLRRGGAARIAVVHDGTVKIEVTRGRRDVAVAARTLGEDESELRIADLAPGTYRLRIHGSGALQQYATTFAIREGEETPVDVMIVPQRLTVLLRRGGARVGDATVELMHTSGKWRGSIAIGSDGTTTEELWQNGELAYAVSLGGFGSATVSEGEEVKLSIDLPTRRIAGSVVDAENGKPIGGAEVRLEVIGDGGQTMRGAKSDATGKFAFESVDAGKATITASAKGYLAAVAEGREDVALRLQRALEVPIAVVDHRGLPADAVIIDAASQQEWATDANGAATIPFARGETKRLFVVPRGGSFAVVRVAASSEPVRIAIPPGLSSIRIHAALLKSLSFDVRYNGELLPEAVYRMQRLAPVIRNGEGMLANVPLGLYELLPIGVQAKEPVRIAVQPGENVVSLTFGR